MSNFANDMRLWAEKTNEDLETVTKAFLFDLTSRVIKKTPLDKGRARNNWLASLNSPRLDTVKYTEKTGNNAIKRAAKKIDKAFGKVYYLSNNLPYIYRLEYEGWSTQAPDGMARISIIEANNALQKAIKNVNKG